MKVLIALTTLALSASAFASGQNLVCSSKAKVRSLRNFKVSDYSVAEPQISINDAPFQQKTEDRGLVDISFSNECDSSYRLVFSDYAIADLKAGHSKSIHGMLIYDNVELSEIVKKGVAPASESIAIDCRLN